MKKMQKETRWSNGICFRLFKWRFKRKLKMVKKDLTIEQQEKEAELERKKIEERKQREKIKALKNC